jgi:tetratricopeptide (TPR) repeat protein
LLFKRLLLASPVSKIGLMTGLMVLLAQAASAQAQPVTPEESARAHHEQGRLQFSLGRYETAISEFRKAYELRADPSFLFDIAEAYRSLGAPDRAVFFYRRYLTTHPNPPNRPEVEAQIALIEPTIPPGRAVGPTALRLSPRAQPLGRTVNPLVVDRGPADTGRGLIGKWWFWTAVGTLAAVGATIAIVTFGQSNEEKVPSSDLGHAKLF